ncbi:hypothetical protein LWM68_18855 [Niabella sp. W65]|nr:hypothetical protein [Niabella sp. W65]MCH7364633.1 hypothetical protein [Niabella sp. W65]ULT40489.1 hypothetical protein KRR40_37760 [Niabella sp. I65]
MRLLFPQEEQLYTFWDYLFKAYERNAGMRLDHILLSPVMGGRLKAGVLTGMCADGKSRVTMRPYGSGLKRIRSVPGVICLTRMFFLKSHSR